MVGALRRRPLSPKIDHVDENEHTAALRAWLENDFDDSVSADAASVSSVSLLPPRRRRIPLIFVDFGPDVVLTREMVHVIVNTIKRYIYIYIDMDG
jgi:hypothetical protein